MRTLDGGPAWRQTSFYPFMHASRFGRGTVLRVEPDGPTYEVDGEGAVAAIEATAVLDEAGGALTVFAVNRSGAALPLEVVLRELDGVQLAEHIVLADDDLDAGNTAEHPDRIAPSAGVRRGRRGRQPARRAAPALLERAAADRRRPGVTLYLSGRGGPARSQPPLKEHGC